MGKYRHPISDLTAGELSPKMRARWETPLYQRGAQTLENWLPFPQGGVTLRPGTLHVTGLPGEARFIPFVVSSGVAYLIVITAARVSAYRDGVERAYWTSPWTSIGTIRQVSFAQVENSIVLCHRSTPPKTIVHTALDTLTFSDFVFNGQGLPAHQAVGSWSAGTVLDQRIARSGDNYYYRLSDGATGSTAPSGQDATEENPFDDGGVLWRWLQEVPFVDAGTYPGTVAHFNGRLWFAGSARFPSRVWASAVFDYGNLFYFDVVSYTARQLRDPAAWTAKVGADAGSAVLSTGSADPTQNLQAGETYYAQRVGGTDTYAVASWQSGMVTLSSTVSAADAGQNRWVFSRWSDPQSPEYEDVTSRRDIVQAANALMLELGSDQCDEIVGMATGRTLVINTATAEWVVPPDISATNIQALLQTRYGCNGVQPTLVNDAVLFFQQGGRRLREYFYRNESGAYESPDLTFLADHVLGPGAIAIDFSQVPLPVIWALRDDGQVAACVYDKQSGARAWCRLTFGTGEVKALAVLPGADGDDEPWLEVKRGTTYHLERLAQPWSGHHLDRGGVHDDIAASVNTYIASTTFTLFDEETGETGTAASDATGNGAITIPVAMRGHRVHWGIPFTAVLETMPLAPSPAQQALGARPVSAVFRVVDSYPFEVGPSSVPEPVTFDAVPWTGDSHEALLEAPISTQATVKATGSVRPVTIVGIMAEVDVTEIPS